MATTTTRHRHVVEKTLAGDVVKRHGTYVSGPHNVAASHAGLMARSRAIRNQGEANKVCGGYWVAEYRDGGAIFEAQTCIDMACDAAKLREVWQG